MSGMLELHFCVHGWQGSEAGYGHHLSKQARRSHAHIPHQDPDPQILACVLGRPQEVGRGVVWW